MTGKRRAAAAATIGLMALLARGTVAASAPGEGEVFEIALWASGDGVERLPSLVATADHPCGAIAVLRLGSMPTQEQTEDAVAPEIVAEIDAGGTVLRRWSAPVDYRPLAIRRDALLLDTGEQRLWIGTDGGIRRGDPAPPLSAIEPVACPAEAPHAGSAYRRCGVLRDLDSGARRLIVYESACT